MDWNRITLHHTAGHDGEALDYPRVRRFHTAAEPEGRGWSDIGYHWVIEQVEGEYVAVMGRPMYRNGSHALNNNTGNIGVALVGDFSVAPPPLEQVHAAAELCAALCVSLGIRSDHIIGHREIRQTRCPGLLDVEQVRDLVKLLRQGRWPRAVDLP